MSEGRCKTLPGDSEQRLQIHVCVCEQAMLRLRQTEGMADSANAAK